MLLSFPFWDLCTFFYLCGWALFCFYFLFLFCCKLPTVVCAPDGKDINSTNKQFMFLVLKLDGNCSSALSFATCTFIMTWRDYNTIERGRGIECMCVILKGVGLFFGVVFFVY